MLGNKGSETPESGKRKKKQTKKNLLISDFFDRKEKNNYEVESWEFTFFFFIDWYIFIFKSFICHSQALLFPSSI